MSEIVNLLVGSSTELDIYFFANVISFAFVIEFIGYLTGLVFQVIKR